MEAIAMPTAKTMKRLQSAAAKLNRESDELNGIVREFEESLENMGVGISVWLSWLLDEGASEYDGNEEMYSKSGWELGFCKLDGKWRLAVRETKLVSPDGRYEDVDTVRTCGRPVALANAPRLLRIQAADLFEPLAISLACQLEQYTETIEKAKQVARLPK